MKKVKVAPGIYWVEIPEANLFILCGCPADSVKHLMKKSLIIIEEKDGATYETGPNAILFSDVFLQNERFSNLAEFPVLQMLYRQGMILPGHPKNTGIKPLLIGIESQVKAQVEYIYRGNYGLTSVDEIIAAGVPLDQAQEMMRLKLRFALDRIRSVEELVETRIVNNHAVQLRNGVFIHRKGLNLYEFMHRGHSVTVDLNLSEKEEYEPPYQLGYHEIKREYFSVVHTGEGDGWDVSRPCMASIIIFQGKVYLIDAGPNVLHSLRALGIGVSEIEGIFHTHAHDDHFNGLPVLLRSDHKIKYYATPLVRTSVVKKLIALIAMNEEVFAKYFEIRDLQADVWNNVEGLEVMPIYSPHPVETNIMLFRTLGDDGFKTYAHFADVSSLGVLKNMITDNPLQSGISGHYYEKIKNIYLTSVDVKKVDIGGGLIHGNAEDFGEDASGKIILSHTAFQLTDSQKEIGDSASFGMADVLISAQQDYTKAAAFQVFQSYFPMAQLYDLRMLLNCPVISFNPGSILIRKGEINSYMFFILSGVLEFLIAESGVCNTLTAGSIAGELSGLSTGAEKGTYRTISFVKALQIPCALYIEFLKRNNIYETIKREVLLRWFLQNTWLFGDRITCHKKSKIAQSMVLRDYSAGERLSVNGGAELFLLENGEVEMFSGTKMIETLSRGGFFGEETIIYGSSTLLEARVSKQSRIYHIPKGVLDDIPIVQWKLLETFERRRRAIDTGYDNSGE